MSGSAASRQQVPMSVRHLQSLLLVAGLTAMACAAMAEDDEDLPDPDLLEYLGSWEESDEDWVIVDRLDSVRREVNTDRSDPEPQGEETQEKEHDG